MISFFQELSARYQEFTNNLNNVLSDFLKNVKDLAVALEPIKNAITMADNCKNNQWVIFFEVPQETILLLNEAQIDCNIVMHEYFTKDDYANFKQLYDEYKVHESVAQHKLTLEQAAENFIEGKQYNLIAYALVSVFDGTLSNITKINKTFFAKRINKLIDNNATLDEILDKVGVKGLAFMYTFDAIEEFVEFTDFDNDTEPHSLNRHWIAHGRSTKLFTEIDCLKLFNFIFALVFSESFNE